MTRCPLCYQPGGFHTGPCTHFTLPADWSHGIVTRVPPDLIGAWLTADLREHRVRFLIGHAEPPEWTHG